ncbi:BrnA antitoxin family protein [Rhizobium leguminosarum]|uniref:BrnA antitoxin family protein n=1 Tax=Rhizobium leguminosarum TaxID=384 RepID=UPI001C93E67E|nr:BrnA antitoxin family protein [Rhizobium leguminosarum]MBY5702830.1 BrnA antitoxin family protein [Rhizobium leguminosarum]
MTAKYPVKKEFQSGNGYSKEDWDAVDSPELTDEELASARPAAEVLPKAFFDHVNEGRRGRGRPALEQTKQTITIRLDPDVIEHYRSSGRGWQSRINDDLRKLSGLEK